MIKRKVKSNKKKYLICSLIQTVISALLYLLIGERVTSSHLYHQIGLDRKLAANPETITPHLKSRLNPQLLYRSLPYHKAL
jgi:hypothetical protein